MALDPDGPPSLRGSPLSGDPTLEFEDRRPFKLPKREPALGRFLMRLRGASVEGVAQEAMGSVSLRLHKPCDAHQSNAISQSPCPGIGVIPPRLMPRETPDVSVPPCPEGPFDQLTTTDFDMPWSLPRVRGVITLFQGQLKGPHFGARSPVTLGEALGELRRGMADPEPQSPFPPGVEVRGALGEDLKALRCCRSSGQGEEVL